MSKIKFPLLIDSFKPTRPALHQVTGYWHARYGALEFMNKEDHDAVAKETQDLLMKYVGQPQTEATRANLRSEMKSLMYGMGMNVRVETEIDILIEGPEHVMVLEDGSVYIYKIPDVLNQNGLNLKFYQE